MRKFSVLLIVAMTIMVMTPVPSDAFPSARLMSCQDVKFVSFGARSDNVLPMTCRSEFSASDPFIVLIVDIRNVDRDTGVIAQVQDPNGTSVTGAAGTIEPPPGVTWSHYWIIRILPVAATQEQIAGRDQTFQNFVVGSNLTPPVRERLGEWVLTVTLAPGGTTTHKFTLKP